jgi:hypothetical protein
MLPTLLFIKNETKIGDWNRRRSNSEINLSFLQGRGWHSSFILFAAKYQTIGGRRDKKMVNTQILTFSS